MIYTIEKRNLIFIHSKMKCTFLPASGKTLTGIFDPSIFHCISVTHPVKPCNKCPFLPIEEFSPDCVESEV